MGHGFRACSDCVDNTSHLSCFINLAWNEKNCIKIFKRHLCNADAYRYQTITRTPPHEKAVKATLIQNQIVPKHGGTNTFSNLHPHVCRNRLIL